MIDTSPDARSIDVCAALAGRMSGDLLLRTFSTTSNVRILSVSTTVDDALEELSRRPYGILLTNLHLNQERHSGLRLLAQALSLHEGLRAVVLTESSDPKDIVMSFRAGASGYLVEGDTGIETLAEAIRQVDDGRVWVSCEHMRHVSHELAARTLPQKPISAMEDILSTREREVVELMIRGNSNKEIAMQMNVSEHTVRNHLAKIFAKLGVTSRTRAIFQLCPRYVECADQPWMPKAELPPLRTKGQTIDQTC
jgi:DNA-binding NarL/FixJ family response regulator